jgi:hypothetical protein
MSDSRADVKLAFSIYGMDFKHEMSINWTPEDCNGYEVDRRLLEIFDGWYQKARARWDEEVFESQREQRAKEEEERERSELARLKAKYEPRPPSAS